MAKSRNDTPTDEETEQRRDELLKRLLKKPPQPRPKRDRKKDAEAAEVEKSAHAAPRGQSRECDDKTG